MLDGLLHLVNRLVPVSKSLEKDITENVVINTIAKNGLLLKEGQICDHLHFIVKGILISYYERNESEIVNWIFMENDFTISLTSFYKRVPSIENIMAFPSFFLDLEVQCHISMATFCWLFISHN